MNEKQIKKLSRRSFLKAGGLVAGAVAAGVVTGCGDPDVNIVEPSSSGTPTSNLPSTWDGEADLVLIGFGGAASMAAIQAVKDQPSVKILILEAQKSGGGSTKICGAGTYLGCGTKSQTDAGFTETADQLYNVAVATAGVGANTELLRVWADNMKETYDSLIDIGFKYGKYADGYFSSPDNGAPDGANVSLLWDNEKRPGMSSETPVPHIHFGLAEEGSTRAGTFWKALEDRVKSLSNVTITYETEAKQLLVNSDGRVVGVKAKKGGSTLNFKASKAVMVATGGFINNDEMVAQFIPHALNCWRGGNAMDTGTGIKMAQSIGADVKGMSGAEDWYPTYHPVSAIVKGIAVNEYGDRFCSEDVSGPVMGRWVARVYNSTYMIFDKTIMDEIPTANQTTLGAVQANSIAELATALGINEDSLESTVDRYNAYAVAGQDKQFQKDTAILQEIKTAPFYAVAHVNMAVFTLSTGGLCINTETQVMDTAGEVIKGLYAAGATTAHINAEHYLTGGGTSGAFSFGRLAGKAMVKETNWE